METGATRMVLAMLWGDCCMVKSRDQSPSMHKHSDFCNRVQLPSHAFTTCGKTGHSYINGVRCTSPDRAAKLSVTASCFVIMLLCPEPHPK